MNNEGDIQIDGKRIYLRTLTEKDASEEYCNWLNDPVVNKFLETRKATIEDLKKYINEKRSCENCIFLGIFLRNSNKHIGNIKLEPIDFEKKEATVGILIGDKDCWGKGICTEAIKLLVGYAFKNYNINKIKLGVITENIGAIRCYLNAGFNIEEVKSDIIKHEDKYYDKMTMAITRSRINIKKGIELWNRAKKIIPGGSQLLSKRSEMLLPDQWPSYYKKAKGIEVWDLDGNRFTDMYSMGIGSCILGYADDEVNSAVKKSIDSGSMSTLNCPEEVELAELLLKKHSWARMVRYTRTGGEALTVAVRIARAYSKKDKVAFCGYHGWHDWYLSANLADDKNLDGHLLPGLEPKGVPRALKGTSIPFTYNKIEELEEIIENNKDIGVILVEPIRHHNPENDFLGKVRKIADEINVPLIFDEVTSGWRINVGGAHEKYGVYPDVVVYGKGMSNGFPMAAVVGKEDVMQAAQTSFISSTYWTERIGPTAAIATINKMKEKNVPDHLCRMGQIIGDGWRKLADENELKIEVMDDFLPLITFAFDYEDDLNQAVRTLLTQEMLYRGFLASTSVYVSYSHNEENIEKYFENVNDVFKLIKNSIDKNNVYNLLKGPVAHKGFKRLT